VSDKIWVDLNYTGYQIAAYRLDTGWRGTLKGNALKKAEQVIDLYEYSGTNYPGIYGEIDRRV